MTQTAKTTTLTLAGLVGAVILVASVFPYVEPILNWLLPILQRESVQRVGLGWLAAAFTLPLPWVLPKHLAPLWTKTFAAALAGGVAVTVVLALAWPPTRTDVIYAVFMAGLGSITINGGLTAIYLHFKPSSTPESLQP